MRKGTTGLTLIELLFTIAIAAIVLTGAVPSLTMLLNRQRLSHATDTLSADIHRARNESITQNRPISIAFYLSDASWCYRVTGITDCDCTQQTCPDTALSTANKDAYYGAELYTNLRNHTLTFSPQRGTGNPGTITLTYGGRETRIIVSNMGRIRICSPDLAGFPPC